MAFISNGTTILDNGAFSVGLGSQILLSTATASASASIEFTSGIDSTYDIYKFEFINCHPATDGVYFQFQVNASGQTGFNETMTTTAFRAEHYESDAATGFAYHTPSDQAQGTSYQRLTAGNELGNANDESVSGNLFLFAPSSTTYVKHFIATTSHVGYQNIQMNTFIAGYVNTTSAIDEIAFKMSSGNVDAGTIKMYGIKGS